MKRVFLIFICLIPLASMAQRLTYAQYKQDALSLINLRPEYGKVVKTKEQIETDNTFIKTSLAQYTTREKASAGMIDLGFRYLYQGDLETAMKRFNQAWLLNPKNENAYWGYGAVYFTFGDTQEALKQFNNGLVINPRSPNILTDKATIYTSYYISKREGRFLDEAINLFVQSYHLDPKNQNTLFKMSVAYFYKRDCESAKRYYNECMLLGGNPIPEQYTEALKKQCGK